MTNNNEERRRMRKLMIMTRHGKIDATKYSDKGERFAKRVK